MIVQQLIAKLAELDQQADVVLRSATGGFKPAQDVLNVAEDLSPEVRIESVLID